MKIICDTYNNTTHSRRLDAFLINPLLCDLDIPQLGHPVRNITTHHWSECTGTSSCHGSNTFSPSTLYGIGVSRAPILESSSPCTMTSMNSFVETSRVHSAYTICAASFSSTLSHSSGDEQFSA